MWGMRPLDKPAQPCGERMASERSFRLLRPHPTYQPNQHRTMTHDEMIAVLAAHRDGKAVQVANRGFGNWKNFQGGKSPSWKFHSFDYRIKPATTITFPELPPGEEWHNPAGLTPEQFGAEYQPLTKRERKSRDEGGIERNDASRWEGSRWRAGCRGICEEYTYRIPRSVPIPTAPAWSLDKLPGFRPLREGERWHRNDWTLEMLEGVYRPLLEGEKELDGDECLLDGYEPLDPAEWVDRPPRFVAKNLSFHRRTRRALPEPAQEAPYWDCAEDVPGPVCWLRNTLNPDSLSFEAMILAISARGISYTGADEIRFIGWHRFQLEDMRGFEHSTDRKTWLPCRKGARV